MTNANNDVRELEDLLTELEGQGALPAGPYSDEDDAVTQLMDAPLGEQEWMVQVTPHDRRMMSTDQLLAEIATGHLVRRDTLVWRATMSDWAPIARVDELMGAVVEPPLPMTPERRPLPPPPAPIPPTRLPSGTLVSPGALPSNGSLSAGALSANGAAAPSPSGLSSNTMPSNPVSSNAVSSNAVSSSAVPRTPLPPVPSTPYGASKLTPVPSAPYGAPKLTPVPLTPVPDAPPPAPLPYLNSAFGALGVTPVPSASPPPEPPSTFNIPLPAAAPAPPTMRANTPRPVAVDFSEMEPVRATPMKILVGSGVAALAMIVGTVYALSAGGVFDANAEVTQTSAAAASRATTPSPEPVAAQPAEAKPAETKPVEDKAPEQKVAEAKPEAESGPSKNEPQTQPASAQEEMVAEPEPKAAPSKLSEPRASSKQTVEAEPTATGSASDDSAPEASESPRGSRAERRMAARLRKRATTAAATAGESGTGAVATAPRRSKPRAAAVAATPAVEADESAKGGDTPGSTFNKQAAKTALDDAAAQARNCRPQGGPSGAGRVQVRYEPTGKVGEVSILTPQFDNTTTGSCVVMVFRRASIPAFTGSPAVVMNKNFEIP